MTWIGQLGRQANLPQNASELRVFVQFSGLHAPTDGRYKVREDAQARTTQQRLTDVGVARETDRMKLRHNTTRKKFNVGLKTVSLQNQTKKNN